MSSYGRSPTKTQEAGSVIPTAAMAARNASGCGFVHGISLLYTEAFRAAMAAVGMTDPASCIFVGDRPYDDIYGAKRLGMRGVLIPNSEVPPHDGVVPDAIITRLAE